MKKGISLLLAILMMITVFPIGALADSVDDVIQNGAEISTIAGEIKIQLSGNEVVDESTLSGITLTKVDGDAIKGAVVCSHQNNIITLKFGRLDAGDYIINVPSANETFTFTAVEEYLTKQNFDNNYAPAQKKDNLTYIYGKDTVPSEDLTGFVSMSDGAVKISLANAQSTGTRIGMLISADNLPDGDFNSTKNIDDDKVYVVDADIKASDSGYTKKLFGQRFATNDDEKAGTVGQINLRGSQELQTPVWGTTQGASAIKMLTGTAWGTDLTISNSISNGWFKPRLVLRRDANGALASDLYNRVNNSFTGTDDYVSTNSVNHIGLIAMMDATTTGSIAYVDNVYVRPERLMSILKADYNTSNDTIKLYMTDDIAETTAENIVVKNGDDVVENYSVDVDNSNRTITLYFADGLAEGIYSMNIADVQSSNGIKSYADEMFSLMVEDKTALVPVSSVPDGGTISTIAGEIKISFGREIDPSTVTTNSIKLRKANDEPIKGTYTVSTIGKDIIVKFGRLESDAEYALTVENSILTDGDVSQAVESKTITFTAVEEYLTKQTFDAGYVPTQGKDNLTYIYGKSTVPPTDLANFVSMDNGAVKIQLATAQNSGTRIGMLVSANSLPEGKFNSTQNINDDIVYVIDADIKATDAGYIKKLFGQRYTTGTDGKIDLRGGTTGLETAVWGTTQGISAIKMLTTATWSADNAINNSKDGQWFKPRLVLRRDSNGAMASDLYNRVNNSYTGTDDYVVVNDVEHIGLIAMLDATATTSVAWVDNVYVRPERLMSVLKADYNTSNKTITLYMTDDIDEETAQNIIVKSGNEVVEDYTVDVDSNERAIILTFENGFDGSNYSFDISNMMSANGIKAYSDSKTISIPSMTKPVYTDGNDGVIDSKEKLTAATAISVSASISGVEDVVGILAVYDKNDGSLINTTFASITSNGELTATLTGLDAGTTKEVKLFIWKDLTTITPLFPSDCL